MGPFGVGDLGLPASDRFRWSDAPRGRVARTTACDPARLRYVGVRPIDSAPVDGPPSSAHSGRHRGGRTIGPALRAGHAFARNLRKPVCGFAADPLISPSRICRLGPRTTRLIPGGYAAGSQVQSGDLGHVHTPGIAAGESRHEDLANDAPTLTDALLLVLQPQLVAGDAERLASVINARFQAGPAQEFTPRGYSRTRQARHEGRV
jgi:hypothetical protein